MWESDPSLQGLAPPSPAHQPQTLGLSCAHEKPWPPTPGVALKPRAGETPLALGSSVILELNSVDLSIPNRHRGGSRAVHAGMHTPPLPWSGLEPRAVLRFQTLLLGLFPRSSLSSETLVSTFSWRVMVAAYPLVGRPSPTLDAGRSFRASCPHPDSRPGNLVGHPNPLWPGPSTTRDWLHGYC